MTESGFDAVLLTNPENFHYFSGFRKTWCFAWLHALVIPRSGPIVAVVPQISHEIMVECSWVDEVIPHGGAPHWGYAADSVSALTNVLTRLGLAQAHIGLEMGPAVYSDIVLDEYERLKMACPQARFGNAMPFIWEIRMVKSPYEIGIIRRLCEITAEGVRVGLEAIHEGATEREILKKMWAYWVDQGAFDSPMSGQMMIRGGAKKYSMSTPRSQDTPLRKGRQLFFDGGPCYKGYHSDMQRLACVGPPTDLQKRLFEVSLEGQIAAEQAIRPGNKVSDIHEAAMRVIGTVPADLRAKGVEWLYSHTFMGHGEGLAMHEPPWITADEHRVLKPGMVLCLEVPGLDVPQFRELGGFPEDIYLVTEEGHETLTKSVPRDLWIAP
jgi:Xaa-Pro aminopeptidase